MRARPSAQKATRPMTDLAEEASAPAVATTVGVGWLVPLMTVTGIVVVMVEAMLEPDTEVRALMVLVRVVMAVVVDPLTALVMELSGAVVTVVRAEVVAGTVVTTVVVPEMTAPVPLLRLGQAGRV